MHFFLGALRVNIHGVFYHGLQPISIAIGLLSISQLRTCVIKLCKLERNHLTWITVFKYHINELLLMEIIRSAIDEDHWSHQ